MARNDVVGDQRAVPQGEESVGESHDREQGLITTNLDTGGADQVPGLDHYRAKVLQEDILKAGPLPYSIVRATQFFEFMDAGMSWTSDEHTVRLPATPLGPIAADDVARAVADVTNDRPLQGARDIAGPDVLTLDEIGRITLAARGDHRTVTVDNTAGMFATVAGDAIIAGQDAVVASTTYQEWLRL